MEIINPATGAIIRTVAEDGKASLDTKLAALKAAQPAWAALPLAQRLDILRQFSELLESEKNTLAATLTEEMGKPLQQAVNEINGARTRIKWLL